MARIRHPELPDCKPVPLRYKHVPTTNGDGKALFLCGRCEGDGHICTAEKKTFDRHGATVTETIGEFPGTLCTKRVRGGVYSFIEHLPGLRRCGSAREGRAVA